MEMKAEQLVKYNKQYPMPAPKHGRFAPDGQFFLCETAEQIAELEAAGWNDNPFKHVPPYKPEKARLVQKWDDLKIHVEPSKPAVPAVDVEALQRQLAEANAKLAAIAEAPKVGRPRKVA